MRSIKGKTTWIDIVKPSEADIAALKKQHGFHPIILDELSHPSVRARAELYGSYIFLVYHVPVYDPNAKTSRRAEIDFLITKNKVATIHHEQLEQIDAQFQTLLRDEKLRKEVLNDETYALVHFILEQAITFSARQMRHIEERVSFISEQIFNERAEGLLQKISYIKRDILDFRLITKPQGVVLESLLVIGEQFWGEKSRVYLTDLIGENLKILHVLENYFEIIESLETTNAQLLGAETNTVIKKFTILAFLTSIPLFFVFFVEIKYIGDIVLATPLRFWTIFMLVLGSVAYLTYVFKKRKIL